MELSKGTLLLVKSTRAPVFGTSPFAIEYMRPPKKGQAFLFTRDGSGRVTFGNCCNTSTIQKVTTIDGFKVLKTLNSTYIFMPASK